MDILQQQLPLRSSTSGATSHHPRDTASSAVTVSTLADQNPQPSGNLDSQENLQPQSGRANNKRRLSLRSRQDSIRRPRPLHLDRTAKSSSVVPTITDLAVGRTASAAVSAAGRGDSSPSLKSHSWLAKSSVMASQPNSASPAEDLLRQTIMQK